MAEERRFTIEYRFELEDSSVLSHKIAIGERSLLSDFEDGTPPDWTSLDYQRCEGCPLVNETHCPVALRLVKPLATFRHLPSYAQANVTVVTEERDYVKRLDVQEGLRSLIGLIMATSGCPSMAPFKPMARYHLPFSSLEETIYRIVSAYLLRQLIHHPGSAQIPVNMVELTELYNGLAHINAGLGQRIRVAVQADGALNALVIFNSFSQLIPSMIEEELENIRTAFD